MAQHALDDFSLITDDGNTLAADLNAWYPALHSMHLGSSDPSYAVQGMMYPNSTSADLLYKVRGASAFRPAFQLDDTNGVVRVAMDADADSYIVADTDDEIRFVTGGADAAKVKSTGIESSSFRKTGGALMASPPIFDTSYGGETIGASDDGKSYLVDLASQETFSIAAISGLSTGWSVTVRVIGDPSGYQTAKIGTTGTLLFRGEDSTDDFYLIGNGEAFTLNKASDGKIHISNLSSPKRLTNFGTFTSSAVYNNGFTTWTSIPLDASSGFAPLISRANGGGTVSVSGVYSIICASRHYITTSGQIGNSEMKLQAGGEELASDLQFHEYQEGGQRALSASVYLKHGDTIDCQQIASTAFLYYLPNNGYVTVSLISR